MPVSATWGIPTYYDDDRIGIPITFARTVHSIEVSDFLILSNECAEENAEGECVKYETVDIVESYIDEDSDTEYILYITPERETKGSLRISIVGRVYTTDVANPSNLDPILDSVNAPILVIGYDTREPRIIARQIPSVMTTGVNSVYLDLNREVIGITPQSFIVYGESVGIPILYAAPSPETEYPAGVRPLPFSYELYENTENPRRYFRLDFEFPNPPPVGSLNVLLKEGAALGFNSPLVEVIDDTPPQRQEEPRGLAQVGFAPSLTMDDASLFLNEDFRHTGTISNASNLTNVYVEGLLRGWTYEWDKAKPTDIAIVADAENVARIENGVWKVILVYAGRSAESLVNWEVIQRAPVITNPGFQTFYKGFPIDLDIEISNFPTGVSMDGLLAKMKYAQQETGANLGGIPDKVVDRSENREIIINASTSGGTDSEKFGFNIEELRESIDLIPINSSGILLGVVVAGDLVYALNSFSNSIFLTAYNINDGSRSQSNDIVLRNSVGRNSVFAGATFVETSFVIKPLTARFDMLFLSLEGRVLRIYNGLSTSQNIQSIAYANLREGDAVIKRFYLPTPNYIYCLRPDGAFPVTQDNRRDSLLMILDNERLINLNNIIEIPNTSFLGCAIDSNSKIMYLASSSTVYVLNLENTTRVSYLGQLDINDNINSIAGLDFNNGILYIANGRDRKIYLNPAWSG